MKRERISAAVLAMALAFSACGGPAPLPQSAGLDGGAPAAVSEPEKTAEADSIAPTPASEFDKGHFTAFLHVFCRFVHTPVSSVDDLKQLDLFYLLVTEAEEYGKLECRSHATDEGESAYRFPLAELRAVSDKLLGFEIDFTPYQNNTYFGQNGYPANYFDNKTEEFFIVFSSPFHPGNAEAFTSLLDVVSIDLADGQLTAVCRLEQSQGLGTSSVTKGGYLPL